MAHDEDHAQIAKDFDQAVNMTPTDDSKSVGWAGGENKTEPGGQESVGHKSGAHIIAIRRKKKGELTEDDYAHMKKVVGYVHRHMAQKPGGDVEHSRWRYSLMNWGHDPLKG